MLLNSFWNSEFTSHINRYYTHCMMTLKGNSLMDQQIMVYRTLVLLVYFTKAFYNPALSQWYQPTVAWRWNPSQTNAKIDKPNVHMEKVPTETCGTSQVGNWIFWWQNQKDLGPSPSLVRQGTPFFLRNDICMCRNTTRYLSFPSYASTLLKVLYTKTPIHCQRLNTGALWWPPSFFVSNGYAW